METTVKILSGIKDEEKTAYLAAIASIATADSEASSVEIEHMQHLCDAADLSPDQAGQVLAAATDPNQGSLMNSLDILKTSDLRFSLVTDLFAFAKSDGNYSESEQHSVQQIAEYLHIDQTQFGLLGELAEKTNAAAALPADTGGTDILGSLGLGDKLKASGINGSSLVKGLISIAAPIIIGKMMGRKTAGPIGSSPGASTGGGGLLGGGGLGSLIGMLSGGKGMGNIGGMLGGLFGK